jgi:hypothetical protein
MYLFAKDWIREQKYFIQNITKAQNCAITITLLF